VHALQHLRLATLGVDFEVEDAPVKSRSKSVERIVAVTSELSVILCIHMSAPRLAVLASVLGHTVTAHVYIDQSDLDRPLFFPFGDISQTSGRAHV
jgi:hypothetical protein